MNNSLCLDPALSKHGLSPSEFIAHAVCHKIGASKATAEFFETMALFGVKRTAAVCAIRTLRRLELLPLTDSVTEPCRLTDSVTDSCRLTDSVTRKPPVNKGLTDSVTDSVPPLPCTPPPPPPKGGGDILPEPKKKTRVRGESVPAFEEVWQAWPKARKGSKQEALALWQKRGYGPEEAAVIKQDIAFRLKYEEKWQTGFNPECVKYLRHQHWTDLDERRGEVAKTDSPDELTGKPVKAIMWSTRVVDTPEKERVYV